MRGQSIDLNNIDIEDRVLYRIQRLEEVTAIQSQINVEVLPPRSTFS